MNDALHIVTKLHLPLWARLAFLLGWPVEIRIRVPTQAKVRTAGRAETNVFVDRPRWLKWLLPERRQSAAAESASPRT